jgi:phosphoribosylformimino-5-aminoimidazole carboxamide ribotide isomerase
MYIIPSIDLLAGRCVRLYQGDYDRSTDYGDDPAAIAAAFADAGAVRLHVVDLDAARAPSDPRKSPEGTRRHNRDVIREIRKAFGGVLEVGGGIRSETDVSELLEAGVDRLVVGTLLVKDPDQVERWVKEFGPRFLAGIDARDGEVKVAGWEEGAGLPDTEAAGIARRIGMRGIVYTNIANDGTLSGPDIENTARIARESGLPVIISGGIGSIDDVRAVIDATHHNASHPGIVGIISGKAVYEGRLDLKRVFETFPQPTQPEGNTAW